MKHIFIAVLLLVSSIAQAQTEAQIISPEPRWYDGIHLIGGIGLNSSVFETGTETTQAGVGLNLRSDVGYYFQNGIGLELSGSVMFNRVRTSMLWNTVVATGVRFGLPLAKSAENFAPYGRFLIGKAANVAIFDEGKVPDPYSQYNASRVQTEGNMFGAGLGFFQRSTSGRIWYMELTGEYHRLNRLEAITDVNDVPVVVATENIPGNSALYSLCLTFGLMFF